MTQPSQAQPPSALPLVGLAVVCIMAAFLATIFPASLSASQGTLGTAIALTRVWIIAIVEVIAWLRIAPARTLGVKRVGAHDAMIAIGAGLLLTIAVPLLSVGAAMLTGYATGTVETAAKLSVGIAAIGVLTAAINEEVIYRAAAMSALIAMRAPKVLVLVIPALLFTFTHRSWGVAHSAFVAFPLSLALGALFLWRRSLPVNIIAHLIVDLPVIVLAAVANPWRY